MTRNLLAKTGVVGLLALLALCAPAAAGAAPLLGIQDDPVFVRSGASYGGLGTRHLISRALGYTRAHELGAQVLRITIVWARVQRRPGRSGENWSMYDRAVMGAAAAGFQVQLVLTGPAPAFATGDHHVDVYRPDPRAFARFAAAAARRYAPYAGTFSIWNEPNWWSSLKPNREAPALYRRLYEAGYRAIREADPAAKILIGELMPMGYTGASIAPLRFLSDMTCRDGYLSRCGRLVADGFAVHPYTLRWQPTFPGRAEDVTTGSLGRLSGTLAALARSGALATPSGGALPVYLTEYGWFANYPPINERARATRALGGFQLAARRPDVREIVWYQLAAPPRSRRAIWDTALLRNNGAPRPVFQTLRAWARRPAEPAGH